MTDRSKNKKPLNWKKMLGNSVTRIKQLPKALRPDTKGMEEVANLYPMRINPYFLSLIKFHDDPLGRQVLPDLREFGGESFKEDPLEETNQSPTPLLIHRYPDRVVFLVSNQCAVYCRHCMRKRHVGKEGGITKENMAAAMAYIKENKRIRDVILSGGDPLMLSDQKLFGILDEIEKIDHVDIIRVHTRMLSTLPQRITRELVDILKRFKPLFINTQFNHPSEITREVIDACEYLTDSGIPLGCQTVLLKGVNDDTDTLKTLFRKLIKIRVRPYYLHHPDQVKGTEHFHIHIENGLRLMSSLRGHISGMCMPQYMIDLPGGGGKVPVLPEYVVKKEKDHWVIKNFEGKTFKYPITED